MRIVKKNKKITIRESYKIAIQDLFNFEEVLIDESAMRSSLYEK